MPVVVKTFAAPAEAAAALASDRSARFIAGGTLIMRALNEGDVGISTIVRKVITSHDITFESRISDDDRLPRQLNLPSSVSLSSALCGSPREMPCEWVGTGRRAWRRPS